MERWSELAQTQEEVVLKNIKRSVSDPESASERGGGLLRTVVLGFRADFIKGMFESTLGMGCRREDLLISDFIPGRILNTVRVVFGGINPIAANLIPGKAGVSHRVVFGGKEFSVPNLKKRKLPIRR